MSQPSKIGKTSMRKKNKPNLPGNDGTWFLDMVGATPGRDEAESTGATKTVDVPVVEMAPSAMSAVAARRNQEAADDATTETSAPPTTLDLTTADDTPAADSEPLPETTHTGATAPVAAASAAVAAAAPTNPASTEELEMVSPQPPPPADTKKAPPVPPSVQDTWRPTATQPSDDLTGDALAGKRKKRSRWPFLVTAVVAVAAIVVAALWLPVLIDGRASETADGYRTSLTAMRQTLPEAQTGLALATEPSSQESDVLAAAPLVDPLEATSTSAVAVAAEPLPEPLPLMPSGPIDDLEPSRAAVASAGTDGLDIAQRINDTVVYRTLLEGVLVLPELPIEAGASQIQALEVELESVAVESAAAVSALPTDPAFADHRTLVTESVDRMPAWTEEYLDALRQSDATLAAELVAEAEEVRPALARALVPALATMRAEVDGAILTLNEDIGAVLVALPR